MMKLVRFRVRMVILFVGISLTSAWADDPINYLFAASQTRAEITVIDSSIDQVVGRITLPDTPDDITTLQRGRSIAIADRKGSLVRIVDVLDRHVERVMDVPLVPDVLRSDSKDTMLATLDLNTGKIALGPVTGGTFHIVPNLSEVTYIVFDSKGRLLAANRTGATVVDTTGRRIAELVVDPENGPVMDVAADPGGEFAFVEQPLRGVVSIFNMPSGTRAAVLHLRFRQHSRHDLFSIAPGVGIGPRRRRPDRWNALGAARPPFRNGASALLRVTADSVAAPAASSSMSGVPVF